MGFGTTIQTILAIKPGGSQSLRTRVAHRPSKTQPTKLSIHGGRRLRSGDALSDSHMHEHCFPSRTGRIKRDGPRHSHHRRRNPRTGHARRTAGGLATPRPPRRSRRFKPEAHEPIAAELHDLRHIDRKSRKRLLDLLEGDLAAEPHPANLDIKPLTRAYTVAAYPPRRVPRALPAAHRRRVASPERERASWLPRGARDRPWRPRTRRLDAAELTTSTPVSIPRPDSQNQSGTVVKATANTS